MTAGSSDEKMHFRLCVYTCVRVCMCARVFVCVHVCKHVLVAWRSLSTWLSNANHHRASSWVVLATVFGLFFPELPARISDKGGVLAVLSYMHATATFDHLI